MRTLRRGSTRSKDRVYRAMAAWRLGRPLRGSEVMHHVNGDRRDHHPDNLTVVSSQWGHMLLHHYLWCEEAGVQRLFELEEPLQAQGECVVWPS